jgi:hypothetical protein
MTLTELIISYIVVGIILTALMGPIGIAVWIGLFVFAFITL